MEHAILKLALLFWIVASAGCARQPPVDGAPCPCPNGYLCCLNRCVVTEVATAACRAAAGLQDAGLDAANTDETADVLTPIEAAPSNLDSHAIDANTPDTPPASPDAGAGGSDGAGGSGGTAGSVTVVQACGPLRAQLGTPTVINAVLDRDLATSLTNCLTVDANSVLIIDGAATWPTQVALDCQGHTISALPPGLSGTVGLYAVNGQQIRSFTVKNCRFASVQQGIVMEVPNAAVTMSGNTFDANAFAVVSLAGGQQTWTSNTFLPNNAYGLSVSGGTLSFSGNVFCGVPRAISCNGALTALTGSSQILQSSISGNCTGNIVAPGSCGSTPDAGAPDTGPPPQILGACGNLRRHEGAGYNSTFVLDRDLTTSASKCLTIDGSYAGTDTPLIYATIDCQGHSITASPSVVAGTKGLSIEGRGQLQGLTVKNCVIQGWDRGISLQGVENNTPISLTGNTFQGNWNGIMDSLGVYPGVQASLASNTFAASNVKGIHAYGTRFTFSNDTFCGLATALYCDGPAYSQLSGTASYGAGSIVGNGAGSCSGSITQSGTCGP